MTTLTGPPSKATRADETFDGGADTLTESPTGSSTQTDPTYRTDDQSTPTADSDWRAHAVCKDDPEADRWVDLPQVVIKGRLNPSYDQRLAELSAVCSTCPVMDSCLGNSLAMNVRGVFAGHDEYDRADIRDALGLPTPPVFPSPETEDDARLIAQQFTALRLARRGMSNKKIADELDVSTMTVSRLFAGEDHPAKRRTRSTS